MMNFLKKLTILLFAAMILVPVLLFNREKEAMSVIDNRYLAENPLTSGAYVEDLTKALEDYISDRIGLRDEMIRSYTVLNDRLFHKMVHPTYSYGREGCVFGAGVTVRDEYTEFHEAFVNMVAELHRYCADRNVPFLFVFNPAKPAVYQEYIADGIDYNRDWVDELMLELEERGVPVLDNTAVLTEKRMAGEAVFNWKYDANHWNDLGAFYGVNAILERMRQEIPTTHVNAPEEVTMGSHRESSLMVSDFPIDEEVPDFTLETELIDRTEAYVQELQLDPDYRNIGMVENPRALAEGSPRALVFQGSYMNHYGMKFLEHALGEYNHIHDYQNVLRMPYYFGIFQPEYVVFEVAEYTFQNIYFDYHNMRAIDYNRPCADALAETARQQERILPKESLTAEQGAVLTRLVWNAEEAFEHGWLLLGDEEYDLEAVEGGYQVTVPAEKTAQLRDPVLVTVTGDTACFHRLR